MLSALQGNVVQVRQCPIRADMKPDQGFLAVDRTTVIDMESLSPGDPGFDPAKLEVRVTLVAIAGQIAKAGAAAAQGVLRPFAGPGHPWVQTCAWLQYGRSLTHAAAARFLPFSALS